MAFNDTLFQLGMDLTRSSTAQKEDIAVAVRVASGDKTDFFAERDSAHFAGSHLIVDLIGAKRLDDIKHVEGTLNSCVDTIGSSLLNVRLRRTPGKSVTATFDVFMPAGSDPFYAVDTLRAAFDAREAVLKEHKRGQAQSAHALFALKAKAARAGTALSVQAKRAA